MTDATAGDVTYSKNTKITASLGSLFAVILIFWSAFDIGRPLFAADLKKINSEFESFQKNTAISLLKFELSQLQREVRDLRREYRQHPTDDELAGDIDEVVVKIKTVEEKIRCYRTKGCTPEKEF